MDPITNSDTLVLQLDSKKSSIIIGRGIFASLSSLITYKKWDVIIAIVSETVYALHKEVIDQSLSLIDAIIIQYNDSEQNKSYAYAEQYFNLLLENQCTRNSLVIGIGGGVTTDFAGYVASAYMRGIDVVYVPTTLLAMVDASIGGKVAVNIKAGKNIVGHFHQPDYIIIDIDFLQTLPLSEWRCGMSEVVKHALIGDSSTLTLLMNKEIQYGYIDNSLYSCINSSVRFKASVVEKDEFEKNIRAILNFGHTVGHAIESLLEYTVSHGDAVAAGILIESYISMKEGMPKADFDCVRDIISAYNLLPNISFDPNKIVNHMMYDKKNIKGKTRFVLLESIGKPRIGCEVNDSLVKEALNFYLTMIKK
ncbi:MAG: 3-dehydroquinate synthase [Spirochaetota bacterium]|nr:3-dehydroquinate synthase [Spirochaetota bacterium]